MLSLIIEIKDIHHCKETDHVYAIARTGHGQPTWSVRATWFPRQHVGVTWFRFGALLASVVHSCHVLVSCCRRRANKIATALRLHGFSVQRAMNWKLIVTLHLRLIYR